MAELLRVEALTAGYGEARILQDLAFSLEDGRSLALLGRNGVGKTTLIDTLVGAPPQPRQQPASPERARHDTLPGHATPGSFVDVSPGGAVDVGGYVALVPVAGGQRSGRLEHQDGAARR